MSLTEGDPKAVDLGLGVLWADRNVDSSLPVSFGGYYSWGDLYPGKASTIIIFLFRMDSVSLFVK